MTATLHKITAGDGYLYYIRQVATQDSERGRSALADYYAARGEAPGTWLGSGLPGLTVTYRDRAAGHAAPAQPAVDPDEVLIDPEPDTDAELDPYPVRVVEASRVNAGDVVTEEQMHALFGLGMHPQADAITGEITALELSWGASRAMAERAAQNASRLGRPFRIYSGETAFRQQCARAFTEYNTERGLGSRDPIPDDVRARIRTAVAHSMFRYEFGRGPLTERELSGWVARNSRQQTTAIAGFGVCCSVPKSVSVLRALAPMPVGDLIEQADRLAVADVVDYLEANAAFTRVGRNGVRQVEVEGLIIARFEHRDSRCGDPNFHTHLVIANRCLAADGQWRTLDGSMLYKCLVTASEIYNTRLEHHLETLVGLRLENRAGTDPNKRPIREVVGVPVELIEHFSRRDAAIIAHLGELTVEFQKRLGRDPTTREMYELMDRATLSTRPAKHAPRSLAEQRADWLAQAIEVLGSLEAVLAMLTRALNPPRRYRPPIVATTIARWADQVIATISAERSLWRATHVRSETERVIRGWVEPDQWAAVVDAVVTEALAPARSVPRGDPDRAAEPAVRAPPQVFRRADGASAFTIAGDQLYTSVQTLSAEAQLISMITTSRGHALPADVVESALTEFNTDPAHRDRQLNEGQEAVIRAFATSGLGIQIADAPAGTGKTTAARVLTRAWLDGGGSVCGLAPTAKAAAELAEEISAPVNTVDKLLDVLDRHTPSLESLVFRADRPPPSLPQWILDIDAKTLVIIDEHVQIADAARLRLLIFLLGRGATVRMLGDQYQLQSIDAGGSARDMIHAAGGAALTLTHVVRFADRAEASASLALRQGDPAGLGFYLDRDRVHIGSPAAVVDSAFHAWLADHDGGRDSIMLAATHTVVADLNTLAREHRLAATDLPGPEVELGDGAMASAGDTIRTTSNDRRIRFGDSDFVRNGYTWTVTEAHPDGSLTARRRLAHRGDGDTVHLPADYVAEHVRLGYAATINSVQGVTVDTCHTVLTGLESRYQLYVALTRGRTGNHLYVTTALDGAPEESFWTERAVLPRTATDILVAVLGRDDAATSAHTELRKTLDPLTRIGRTADVYLEAVAVASEAVLGPEVVAGIDSGAEELLPTLTSTPGWPVLRQNLATIALSGRDPLTALREAIGARELATADNIAAVLDWRLDTTGNHSTPTGPLPWLPGIPTALAEHPEYGGYLQALARILTDLAHQLRTTATGFTVSTAPVWARPLIGADPELLADLLIWRGAAHVPVQDLRPAGPDRHTVAERRHHHNLVVRATEAIGDAHLAAIVWAAEVKLLDDRITSDPFWPVLAERLDTAHRAGIDVTAVLAAAMAPRPLPDDMPAAALWSRLHFDTATPPTDHSRPVLAPPWLPDLARVLGHDTAARIVADPAWPTVVAAVEHALTTAAGDPDTRAWSALELLTVAGDLLLDGRHSDRDRLRPDQLATALAWRIDALADHPEHHIPPPSPLEAPPDTEFEPEEDPIPDDIAEFLATAPEHTVPDQPSNNQDSDDHEDPDAETRDAAAILELAARIREVYTRFADGNTDTGYVLLGALPLTDVDRTTIGRVAKTLTTYAFPIAKARLRRAALMHSDLAPVIEACTPETDPGLYRRAQTPRWEPPRDTRHDIDRTRIRDRDLRRHVGRDAADRQTQLRAPDRANNVADFGIDDVIHPAGDLRTHRDPEYGSGEGSAHTGPRTYRDGTTLDIVCVACELDLPTCDLPYRDPWTREFVNSDGLCTDCRAEGRAGIPAHNPADHLDYFRHRCAFIAAARPAPEARAFLRRDWGRAPVARTVIAQFAIDHGLTAASTRPESPLSIDRSSPALRELSDAELDQRITELTQRITLEANLDGAEPAPLTTARTEPSVQRDNATAEAIEAVHAARAEVEAIRSEIRQVAGLLAAKRAELAATPRRKRGALTEEIATLNTTKQELIRRRDHAGHTERDAHRHAVLLAGPPDRWGDDPRATPPDQERTRPAPRRAPVSETERAQLRGRLASLYEERHRRAERPVDSAETARPADEISPHASPIPIRDHAPDLGPEHDPGL